MKRKIIGKCPICEGNLNVTELTCADCGTKISGNFMLSRFDNLSQDQLEFALIFIRNEGNIKLIEKELNISYPTVKKNLADLISALGFDAITVNVKEKLTKEEIYQAIRNKEMSLDEAYELLKEVDNE